MESGLSIQQIECIGGVDENYSLCVIILENLAHGVYRGFGASLKPACSLQWASCFHEILFEDPADRLSYDSS